MQVDLRVLELLSSRLIHELISPVGAIANGVELLGDEDAGFVKDAVALIGQSAKRAGHRLQFYRFAYGTGGAGGGAPEPKVLIAGILDGGKVSGAWPAAYDELPVEWQKLACNLALLGSELLPRGGKLTLSGQGKKLEASIEGEGINPPAEVKAALAPGADVASLTARSVHAYFTARQAERLGAKLTLNQSAPNRATVAIGG